MLEQPVLDRSVDSEFSQELQFWLNGREVRLANPEPTTLLSEYLHDVGLTGTKVGCGQGGCGACTVMISYLDPKTGQEVHAPINSCLRLLCALEGLTVTTVEGLGNVRDGLDPVQHAIPKCNGTQCGFCTPGFVVNAAATLRAYPEATEQQLEDQFGGNICRCTGYRPILHAVRSQAKDYNAEQDQTTCCVIDPSFDVKAKAQPTPIACKPLARRALHFKGKGGDFYCPTSLEQTQRLKARLVDELGVDGVQLVVGNTSMGIYPGEAPRAWIDVGFVHELVEIAESDAGLRVGASVTIQHLLDLADAVIARRPAHETAGLKELSRHGKLIAGRQVRSAGSIAGNLVITRRHAEEGEPFPSDLFTLLATLGTQVRLTSGTVPLTKLPYKMEPDQLIVGFDIPYTRAREHVQTHRVARRFQNSHALVAAGFRAKLNEDGKIEPGDFTAVIAGISRMVVRFPGLEEYMTNKPWNQESLTGALAVLRQEVKAILIDTTHEGTGNEYRARLAENYFYKFFLAMALEVNPDLVTPENRSAAHHHVRPLSHGYQEFHEHPELYPMTRPIIKRAAFVQASGETKYTQDLSLPTGGVHAALIKSGRPHAKFSFTTSLPELEASLHKRFVGFRGLVTFADVPGDNYICLGDDDPVFSDKVVTSVGARIGLALADTEHTAREVAAWIMAEGLKYEDLPAVLTLEEAIKQNTSMPMKRGAADPDEDIQQRLPAVTRPGTSEAWLAEPAKPLPGTKVAVGALTTGAQAHFYLETMTVIAVPGEYDHMTVMSSTQNPNGDQRNISKALGIKANQVTVVLNQIGGGFGGKQHQAGPVGAAAAVAARKLNVPVRLMYDRATDTQCVGKRHPYLGHYHLAYTPEGLFQGLKVDLQSDAGDTYDCSFAVMDLSLMMSDLTYNVANFQANGSCYRTNKTSNTAFRTFGTVQPYLVVEDAIEQVAWQLSRDTGKRVRAEDLRKKNMYGPEDHACPCPD